MWIFTIDFGPALTKMLSCCYIASYFFENLLKPTDTLLKTNQKMSISIQNCPHKFNSKIHKSQKTNI